MKETKGLQDGKKGSETGGQFCRRPQNKRKDAFKWHSPEREDGSCDLQARFRALAAV
jgi:hypothetical protein